jgi:hypothetical protein
MTIALIITAALLLLLLIAFLALRWYWEHWLP